VLQLAQQDALIPDLSAIQTLEFQRKSEPTSKKLSPDVNAVF